MLTVGAVKEKLRIPTSDSSKDPAIDRVLSSARRYFEERTRYDLAGTASQIDLFEDVQKGSTLHLVKRPVTSVTKAEARSLGQNAAWGDIAYDLVDAARGRLRIVSSALDGGWPPRDPPARIYSWREPRWPLVRVTYATSAFLLPFHLEDAVHALAAYWYERQGAGAKDSASLVGVAAQTYLRGAVPAWVDEIFAGHEVRGGLA